MKDDSRKMSPAIPMIVLSIGVLGVSFGSIFARYAAEAPALVRSAYRVGLSSVVLVPYALMFHRREYLRLSRRDFALCVGSGLFLALHFATWIASLDYTSVASSVILVDTIPIWIALFGMVTGRGRMSRRMWAGVLLSVAGVAIVGCGDFLLDLSARDSGAIIDGGSLFGGLRALKGDALAIAGAIAAAAYILCGREARAKLGLAPYVALCYGSAAVFLWVAVLIGGYRVTGFSGVTWGAFVGAAVVSQILGHSSYNWALGYFSAGFVGIMLLGEPLGSAVLAYFLFGEGTTPLKLVGFALLLYAIVIAAKEESA